MRVLLVEDEEALAETLAVGLRADGFAVDIARDGVQALTRLHSTEYDAMVLDIMLPGPSGYEVVRRLRSEGVWVPVLMLTAKDGEYDEADARTCRRADAEIDLTPREFAVLEYLMRHRGQVVSKTQIMANVWDTFYDGDPNVVEVYVGYLRRKIDAPFDRHSIETVRGAGYRLSDDMPRPVRT
jgi:two-component system OmpR family response regulator